MLRYAFGRAAHDLNNYLSGLVGYLALIKDRLGGEPDAARFLALMEKSGSRMTALVKVLADFSEPGRPDTSPVDANAVVRGAVEQAAEYVGSELDPTLELDEAAPCVVAHAGSLCEALAVPPAPTDTSPTRWANRAPSGARPL